MFARGINHDERTDRRRRADGAGAKAARAGLRPVANHAYAVLGLKSKTDTVWLGNPHGHMQSVSSSVFREFFSRVGWGYVP